MAALYKELVCSACALLKVVAEYSCKIWYSKTEASQRPTHWMESLCNPANLLIARRRSVYRWRHAIHQFLSTHLPEVLRATLSKVEMTTVRTGELVGRRTTPRPLFRFCTPSYAPTLTYTTYRGYRRNSMWSCREEPGEQRAIEEHHAKECIRVSEHHRWARKKLKELWLFLRRRKVVHRL